MKKHWSKWPVERSRSLGTMFINLYQFLHSHTIRRNQPWPSSGLPDSKTFLKQTPASGKILHLTLNHLVFHTLCKTEQTSVFH